MLSWIKTTIACAPVLADFAEQASDSFGVIYKPGRKRRPLTDTADPNRWPCRVLPKINSS